MKKASALFFVLQLGFLAMQALAQESWPLRPVRFIVPTSPGGGADAYARLLAQGMGEVLKRQFIVDNRPGAAENIGAEIAARAAPDGYTFLVTGLPPLVINPSLYKSLSYNPERDFVPVARGVIAPIAFTSHPSVPAKTLADLIALAKRGQGSLAYGSAGPGSASNLAVKMVEGAANVRFVHVPYKGGAQAVIGLLRGEVAFMSSTVVSVQPHVQAKRLWPLAVSHHTSSLPSIPTLAEAGYPQIDAYPVFSVVAPIGVPATIVNRMSTEIIRLMKTPTFRERLDVQAFIPVFDSPDEFALVLNKERAKYAQLIRHHKITAE